MLILPAPVRPDLDCIAGALAYAALLELRGQKARVWLDGVPDGEAQFYLDLFSVTDFVTTEDAKAADNYVLVDFSERSFMPDWFDGERVSEVIDHRFINQPQIDFPNAKIELAAVGAAATLIAERWRESGLDIDLPNATMLYGAIYSNTLCLKGALTTPRDRAAADWLYAIHPQANAHLAAQLQARSAELLADMPHSLQTEMKIVNGRFGKFGFSQFELPEAEAFWRARQNEIKEFFATLKHPVVFNLIDLSTATSRIYCNDDAYRATLDHQFNRDGETHRADPARMRKEISLLFT